jgi:hypothetical protein
MPDEVTHEFAVEITGCNNPELIGHREEVSPILVRMTGVTAAEYARQKVESLAELGATARIDVREVVTTRSAWRTLLVCSSCGQPDVSQGCIPTPSGPGHTVSGGVEATTRSILAGREMADQ